MLAHEKLSHLLREEPIPTSFFKNHLFLPYRYVTNIRGPAATTDCSVNHIIGSLVMHRHFDPRDSQTTLLIRKTLQRVMWLAEQAEKEDEIG